ncbi:probable protein S-acyltransferase 7 [Phalaenopsis equestris]|uniref:S-acyltransferase n=1 Tax=Phalaenopsis equestris TaxID=78828 RepID=A0A1S6YG22_PHAEQ|nr:probable protein S-acyltransferase 7 [Phalaenopsis equestris]AQX44215.1 hypothetical protein [Phalaenopsis equestris]
MASSSNERSKSKSNADDRHSSSSTTLQPLDRSQSRIPEPNEPLWKKLFGHEISILNCFGFFSSAHSHSSSARVYQIWPGRNVFFFRGRLICGPDPRGLLLTSVSVILSEWTFCNYICSRTLLDQFVLIVTLSVLLTAVVIVSLIMASTRDPGIIPRNESSPLEDIASSSRVRSRRITIDGIEVRIKYCRICKIFRPPRSFHCQVCDNCVEKFDHHCPWLSQCVGLRNNRYYMMFIFMALVFFVYMLSFSWWKIGKKMSDNEWGGFRAAAELPETFALALFSFGAIGFLGGLAIFHVYLIIVNQTARENFKQRFSKSPNPFDKGVINNIKEALFSRLPPSKINFRAVVEAQDGSIRSTNSAANSIRIDDGSTSVVQNNINQEDM